MALPSKRDIFLAGLESTITFTKFDIWESEHIEPKRDSSEAKILLTYLESLRSGEPL